MIKSQWGKVFAIDTFWQVILNRNSGAVFATNVANEIVFDMLSSNWETLRHNLTDGLMWDTRNVS